MAFQAKRHEQRHERARAKAAIREQITHRIVEIGKEMPNGNTVENLEYVPQFPKSGKLYANDKLIGTVTDIRFEKARKPIAHRSKTNKNTARTITQETIGEVYARDKYECILCGSRNLDLPHHAYFGSQANHNENRNDPDQLVSVCMLCHYDIHSKGKQGKREMCIDYLKNIYAVA